MELEAYSLCSKIDKKVSLLDPLGLDDFLVGELPKLNQRSDPEAIWDKAQVFIPEMKVIKSFGTEEAMAATRDLGMIASSLRRHNIPTSVTPKLESSLLELAILTQEVPADTVTSYGTRNPDGERMRTFTTYDEEKFFIASFRDGMTDLPRSVKALDIAQKLSIFDEGFAESLIIAQHRFNGMVSAIVGVRKAITPSFFTMELRPYFEPKTIGGKKYFAPGGAQMPIILIDQIIWGLQADCELEEYYRENLSYQPYVLRARAEVISKRVSLVEKVVSETGNRQISAIEHRTAEESLTALKEMLLVLEQFRVVHLRIAQDNMAIRPAGSVGSGGYDTRVLEILLECTSAARKRISDLLEKVT